MAAGYCLLAVMTQLHSGASAGGGPFFFSIERRQADRGGDEMWHTCADMWLYLAGYYYGSFTGTHAFGFHLLVNYLIVTSCEMVH